MKKILSILGAISLVASSTTSLVACNKQQYNAEELARLKEENKIKTDIKEIRDNLEWIAPQEKPLHKLDNKLYYVVWRPEINLPWRLTNFKNIKEQRYHKFDELDKYYIHIGELDKEDNFDILINQTPSSIWSLKSWQKNGKDYIKSVYRWNLNKQVPNLIIDNDGDISVAGE